MKFVKTERFQMTSRELTGLLSFLPFLTMEKYYKKAVSLLHLRARKKTLNLKTVHTIKLPIKSHPVKRKRKVAHKYCLRWLAWLI